MPIIVRNKNTRKIQRKEKNKIKLKKKDYKVNKYKRKII